VKSSPADLKSRSYGPLVAATNHLSCEAAVGMDPKQCDSVGLLIFYVDYFQVFSEIKLCAERYTAIFNVGRH
jgi:hypothetical protein